MHTIKYVDSYLDIKGTRENFLVINVDDMNRFIYKSENKIFSIRSPFYVKEDKNRLIFYTNHIEEIDSYISSKILTLINDTHFDSPNSLDFIGLLEDIFGDSDNIWAFVRELLLFEDGYLRYDHDPDNEKERFHPLSHLDICYSTASTFKIGTYHKPCFDYFIQLLDNKLEAKYLEKI